MYTVTYRKAWTVLCTVWKILYMWHLQREQRNHDWDMILWSFRLSSVCVFWVSAAWLTPAVEDKPGSGCLDIESFATQLDLASLSHHCGNVRWALEVIKLIPHITSARLLFQRASPLHSSSSYLGDGSWAPAVGSHLDHSAGQLLRLLTPSLTFSCMF